MKFKHTIALLAMISATHGLAAVAYGILDDNSSSSPPNTNQLSFVIRELNVNLKIVWNAFVALEDAKTDIQLNQLMQQLEIPKMLMTNANSMPFPVYERHPHNLLVIAFVGNNNNKESYRGSEKMEVNKIVKNLLTSIHYTHIVWVYNKAADLNELQEASDNHWLQGYMNCLYFAEANSQIYTYDPGAAPHMKVRHLHNISEYWSRTSISDFKGYPLTFPITASPPRCYRYTNKQGQLKFAGYFYKILEIFMHVYNFKFVQYKSYHYKSYNYTNIREAVLNKKIDFVATSFYQAVDLPKSEVFLNNRAFILVPSPRPVTIKEYFYLPFQPNVWLLNGLTLGLATGILTALLYYQQDGAQHFDPHRALFYVVNVFLNQPYSIHIRASGFIRRYFLFALMTHGFLTTNFYLARLSSTLVLNIYEPKIQTIEQLAKTNLKLFVSHLEDDYIRQLPEFSPLVLERLQVVSLEWLHDSVRNLNNSHAYVVLWDKLKFFLTQQLFLKNRRMHIIEPHLYSTQLYFTVRHELPYIQIFNRYLHNLSASGILTKIFLEVFWEGIRSGEIRFLHDGKEKKNDAPLSIDYYGQPLIFAILGWMLAMITFLCEIAYRMSWKTK